GEICAQPYWMKWQDAPEGTPERQLYETKMAEGISGKRVDPMQQLIQKFLAGDEAKGVPETTDRIRVISPEGQKGTIKAGELEAFKARGFRVIGEGAETTRKRPIRKPMEIKTIPFTREFRGKF
ncbi:unnamed protein product, partial [marine sediment metagenome]